MTDSVSVQSWTPDTVCLWTRSRGSNSEAVKERIGSGQTVEAFCEDKGISKTTYYYRQKKVREAACEELVRAHDYENKCIFRGRVTTHLGPK